MEQNDLRVHNLDTAEYYSTIQEAIDAPETLDGHQISVAAGIYYEHVRLNKSLSLIGEDRSTTIIDGSGMGTVVYVTADDVEVGGFTIQRGTFGVWIDNVQNSKIIGNTLLEGSYGLRLYHSRNSEVIGNDVYGYKWFGIEIESSGNSTLRDNRLFDNSYNFGVNGNSLSDFINDIDVSNTVNGKPIHYLIDQHNMTIDSSTFQEIGYLGLVNSTAISVKDLNVQNNKQGILFAFTKDSAINNVKAENNWNGIYVTHSSNISAGGNHANNNYDYGIKIFNSSRCVARGNNMDNNVWAGMGVFRSPHSRVEGNEVNFNSYDLHLVFANNSVIARNSALTRGRGSYSIAVYYSHNNVIYHNTFVNRLLYVETRNGTRFTPRNSWDNGVEGNFWSSYRGIDADQDGIGDTSYTVGENNVDGYPLMGRVSEFTVTLEETSYSITIISNSSVAQVEFRPDHERISFAATGEAKTIGFSRIAVPNNLLENLHGGNLSFLINAEQPVLNRKWTDEIYTYLYLSYVNSVSESAISPWLILSVASAFLIAALAVYWVVKKKKLGEGKMTFSESKNC